MKLANLGRMLRARGRKVWVITLTREGAVGQRVGIDLLGRTRVLGAKQLWQGDQLPDPQKLGLKRGEAVILLVPRGWLLLKQLTFPPLKPEQLAQVLPFELEEALPKAGELYTAWHQVPQTHGTGVTAFALAQKTIAPVLELIGEAGLVLWGIAPHSWAQALALGWTINCKGEEVLLVSCQGETTEFLQVADGSLAYSYPGGEDRTQDLKTFIQAQKTRPERLVLAGDYDPAMIGQLREDGFAPEEVSTPLPIAQAAVVAYIKGSFPDLAPTGVQLARKAREEQLGNYFFAGLATMVVLIFLGWQSGYHQSLVERHNRATARLAQLEAQHERRPQGQEITQRSDWLSVWAAIGQALPEGVWLSELRLEHRGQLALMGFALSQGDVAALMGQLSRQGLGPVILNYSRQKKIGERQVAEFYLLCRSKDG